MPNGLLSQAVSQLGAGRGPGVEHLFAFRKAWVQFLAPAAKGSQGKRLQALRKPVPTGVANAKDKLNKGP